MVENYENAPDEDKEEIPLEECLKEIINTSEKMNIILSREGKTKKWLAEQWGISPPSITQKFKDDNWKESDIKKFCSIMKLNYEIVFTDANGDTTV